MKARVGWDFALLVANDPHWLKLQIFLGPVTRSGIPRQPPTRKNYQGFLIKIIREYLSDFKKWTTFLAED
jgi:hypothetical protein